MVGKSRQQEFEAVIHVLSTVRKQWGAFILLLLAFSILSSQGSPAQVKMGLPTPADAIKTPSPVWPCPETRLQDDPRFYQVDNSNHHSSACRGWQLGLGGGGAYGTPTLEWLWSQ